jgi:type VI secretion system ImpM family protein
MFGFLNNIKQSSNSNAQSQIGCFGKLPINDEFIRFNVNERSVLDLDEWIQQGYSHYSRDVQTRHKKCELRNCVYKFVFSGNGEDSSTLMGALTGSRDKSGRQYPFVIFKHLPKQITKTLISTLPCAYRTFLENASSLCSTDWGLQPENMLRKRVNRLNAGNMQISRRVLLESEVNALREISKEKFWCDMLQDTAQDRAPLIVEVMKDLLETVVRKSPLRISWGIEIPLPGNDRVHQHVSFWVHAAECLLGCREWRPHYIWGDVKNHDRQSLYLFFRPISPIFFSHLLGHRVDNGILVKLEQECKALHHVSSIAAQIGDLDASDHMVNAFNQWSNWSRL